MTEEKQLYALTALFDEPNQMVHATEAVAKAGYKRFDTHLPYPLHGMDDAMGLKPSKIGVVTFFIGLAGISAMILFIAWVVTTDYRNIFAGKPWFNLLAYGPPMFESMVLSSGVLGTATMLLLFNKLPLNKHPLHDSDYIKRTSDDQFGICIEATDVFFEEGKVRKLFEELGASSISPVYIDKPDFYHRYRAWDPKFLFVLFGIVAVAVGGIYFTLNQLVYMKPFNWMTHQPKVLAQTTSTFFADGFAMRMPVSGTVARNYMPYPFKDNPDLAAKYLSNPLLSTKEVYEKGRMKYNATCAACHGPFGDGQNRLYADEKQKGKGYPIPPPSLHSERMRNWSDGNLYHYISEGGAVMPSYAKQLSRDDRWAVIHYIRALQRSMNPKESDL